MPPAGGGGAGPRGAFGVAASGRLSPRTSVRALTGINAAAATSPSAAREGGRGEGGASLAMAPPPPRWRRSHNAADLAGARDQRGGRCLPDRRFGTGEAAQRGRRGPESRRERGGARAPYGRRRCRSAVRPASGGRKVGSAVRNRPRAALSLRERWRRCGMSRRCGPGRAGGSGAGPGVGADGAVVPRRMALARRC